MTTTKAALSLLLATAATLTFTATSRAAVIFSTYNGNDAGTYTFTPSAALTLTAGTTYWIAVQSTEPENTGASLNWHTSNPQPSSYSSVGVATAGQIFGSGSNPSTWTQTSGVRNSLTIDATPLPIPEPAAPILTGAGLVSMAMLRRRNR